MFFFGFFRNSCCFLSIAQNNSLVKMEDRITIDRNTLKLLASETKMELLKKLGKSQLTLTDMSKTMGMSPSTIKEHLDELSRAGLILQKDEGRKWKYYELTRTGRQITSPTEKRVYFLLGLSALSALFSWSMLAGKFTPSMSRDMLMASAPLMEDAGTMKEAAGSALQSCGNSAMGIPYTELILLSASLIVLGICIGIVLQRKRIDHI